MNLGGERGHRFVGFRDFCVDVSPANLLLSQVRTPTTHLTRFSDKRRSQLLSFSQSGGAGDSGVYKSGGWWGHRFLEFPDPRVITDTLFVHKTLPIENHLIRTFSGFMLLSKILTSRNAESSQRSTHFWKII